MRRTSIIAATAANQFNVSYAVVSSIINPAVTTGETDEYMAGRTVTLLMLGADIDHVIGARLQPNSPEGRAAAFKAIVRDLSEYKAKRAELMSGLLAIVADVEESDFLTGLIDALCLAGVALPVINQFTEALQEERNGS